MLMPPIRMYHCDTLFSCQLVMKLVRYLGAYYPSTQPFFFFFFTLAIKSPQFPCLQLKHERQWTDAPSLQPQPLPCQTMEAGEQPIEKVHLLGQQGRGRRHQPAALREGGPVPPSLLCGKRGCL